MNTTTTHTIRGAAGRLPLAGGLLAVTIFAGAALSACAPAASVPAADPSVAAETAAPEASPSPSADAAGGTQPAGEPGSVLAVESQGILDWQDRWYDNFCSSVLVSMADENCVGLAIEGVALAQTAPARIDTALPEGPLGDSLRAAATVAAAAGDAFIESGCDLAQSEDCVVPTDSFTDAFRLYGDVVAEAVAAS